MIGKICWSCLAVLLIAYFLGVNWPGPGQYVQSKVGL
jgi:hypothetical protein